MYRVLFASLCSSYLVGCAGDAVSDDDKNTGAAGNLTLECQTRVESVGEDVPPITLAKVIEDGEADVTEVTHAFAYWADLEAMGETARLSMMIGRAGSSGDVAFVSATAVANVPWPLPEAMLLVGQPGPDDLGSYLGAAWAPGPGAVHPDCSSQSAGLSDVMGIGLRCGVRRSSCRRNDPGCVTCEVAPACNAGEQSYASASECPQDGPCQPVTSCGQTIWGADPIGCVGVFWWVECGWMKTGGYFLG